MKITDFLSKENCIADLASRSKTEALEELANLLANSEKGRDSGAIFNALMEREKLGSTGIGDHIAIPHAKIKGLDALVAAFARSARGVEYSAVDDKPVRFIFVLLASENATGSHLKALARISRMLKSETFREKVGRAGNTDEIFSAIEDEDSKLG